MFRVKKWQPLIGQISFLIGSHWLKISALHLLKQTVDKHNKIFRSGILIVLTLGSLSDMESLDNSLKLCYNKIRMVRAERRI